MYQVMIARELYMDQLSVEHPSYEQLLQCLGSFLKEFLIPLNDLNEYV